MTTDQAARETANILRRAGQIVEDLAKTIETLTDQLAATRARVEELEKAKTE